MRELPMFPLGMVLLPGQVLPLRIFEPRYRAMIEACMETDQREFGVVLIERGSEVGGGDQRSSFGTVARILEVLQLPAGQYAVVAAGAQRCRVLSWLPDDPYPRAKVEPWGDEVDDDERVTLAERLGGIVARVRRAMAVAVELGDVRGDPMVATSDDPLVASYQLSGLVPLGPADRQRLLGCPGPGSRLDLLERLLEDVEAVQAFRLGSGTAEMPDL